MTLATTFPGGSELAGRMRAFDWDATALGPVAGWPENLRTVLGICLSSRLPTQIWWGPARTFFYNDASVALLGDLHPRALGRGGPDAWPSAWPTIGPLVDAARNVGDAGWVDDLSGIYQGEQGKASLAVSPVFGPNGRVDGVFCTGTPLAPRGGAPDPESHLRVLWEDSRAKDTFIAVLSHELRNPLTPIVTMLEFLRLKDGGLGKELAIIERASRHLLRLVDDLLDISRITRGMLRLSREPTRLDEVVTRAVEMTSPALTQRGLRLDVNVPRCTLDADPGRLAQVFANLLTNAAKFTPPGGHVWVRGRRDDDFVVVEVGDDGYGIDAELLPRVFEQFTQATQGADRARGGLGIGLAIVRSLVTLHGGTVRAESGGKGLGSVFTVRLPLPAAGARPVVRDTERGVPVARVPRRVLVVDDQEDVLHGVARLLGAAGHHVRVAPDGPTALAEARANPPEVAVLDIGLPGMSGYELARGLRAELRPAPLLVALTGYGMDADRVRSLEAGFAAHLTKPDLSGLLDLIDSAPSLGAESGLR